MTNIATRCKILDIVIKGFLSRRVVYSAKVEGVRKGLDLGKQSLLMKSIDKDALIDKLIYELPVLRARIDITQDEVAEMIGVSRQTYSSIETRKRKMSWCQFMSLVLMFYFNPTTREIVESDGVFPEGLKRVLMTNHRRNEWRESMEIICVLPVDSVDDALMKFDNGESLLDRAVKKTEGLGAIKTLIVGNGDIPVIQGIERVEMDVPGTVDHVSCQQILRNLDDSFSADLYIVLNYRFPFVDNGKIMDCISTVEESGGWSFAGEKRKTLLWDKEKNQPINFDSTEAAGKDEGKEFHVETGALYAFEKSSLQSIFEIKPCIIDIEGYECVGYTKDVPFDFIKDVSSNLVKA